MPEIRIGTTEAHEKLTARLFWQPTGENGYIDAGNVADYKEAHENQYRTHKASFGGHRFVDDEQLDETHQKFEFTLTERDKNNSRLINLATQGVDTTQASATGATAQFTSVKKGRTYFLGKRAVSNVVVTVSAAAKTLGTDYTVDLNAGTITILEDGTIADAATVDVTFNVAQRLFQNFTGRDAVLFRGLIRILEYNQLSAEPLREITFTGVLSVISWPEQTGEFTKFSVRATATTKPAITKRHAA